MKKLFKLLFKLIGKLILVAVSLFVVTFAAYYFNLDMKLTAAMEPILFKFYDNVKRDQHL